MLRIKKVKELQKNTYKGCFFSFFLQTIKTGSLKKALPFLKARFIKSF
jgi:hypothetical protein